MMFNQDALMLIASTSPQLSFLNAGTDKIATFWIYNYSFVLTKASHIHYS